MRAPVSAFQVFFFSFCEALHESACVSTCCLSCTFLPTAFLGFQCAFIFQLRFSPTCPPCYFPYLSFCSDYFTPPVLLSRLTAKIYIYFLKPISFANACYCLLPSLSLSILLLLLLFPTPPASLFVIVACLVTSTPPLLLWLTCPSSPQTPCCVPTPLITLLTLLLALVPHAPYSIVACAALLFAPSLPTRNKTIRCSQCWLCHDISFSKFSHMLHSTHTASYG